MVSLCAEEERVRLVDLLTPEDGRQHAVRLLLHLGPTVRATLSGDLAVLAWPGGRATVRLDADLAWSTRRGETDPVLGWYSPRFGTRVPTTVLVGTGLITGPREITTALTFLPDTEDGADGNAQTMRRRHGRHTTKEGRGPVHG